MQRASSSTPRPATTALTPERQTTLARGSTRSAPRPSNRQFGSTLHLTADRRRTPRYPGATITTGISSPTPVVLASDAPYSDSLCEGEADPGTFTGEIVVCERGINARIEKGYNVSLGGAAGFVLYNVGPTDLETDNHFLPAIHVNDPSESIVAFVESHTGVMATWAAGTSGPAQGDVMASFSSRGPLGDFIKPDVTAPGVQILAGESPHHLFSPEDGLGPNGEYYQAIAGTSMSSPHAAGVAAADQGPASSVDAGRDQVGDDDLVAPGCRQGRRLDSCRSIRHGRRIDPRQPRGESRRRLRRQGSRFATRQTATNLPALDLNLPSINAPNMNGIDHHYAQHAQRLRRHADPPPSRPRPRTTFVHRHHTQAS